MLTALRDRAGGRPPKPVDEEKERLRAHAQELEGQRRELESRLLIQEAMREVLEEAEAKKNARCERMIQVMESVAEKTGSPRRAVCRQMAVPYSSLMRWRHRVSEGKVAVGKPGPGKVAPLNLAALKDQILLLSHGRERTKGTGALYEQHREAISRRDLRALAAETRRELRQEAAALERRIEWLAPGLVWSMDDTDLKDFANGPMSVHQVHDLGSRFALRCFGRPDLADGHAVAEGLEALIRENGPPLVFKRDNGSNLNHHAVNEVFEKHMIIPLNSPAYYPPYNGGVERKQQELQRTLVARDAYKGLSQDAFVREVALCGHDMNHRGRDSLGGRVACCVMMQEGREAIRRYGRRERRQVYDQIQMLTVDVYQRLGEDASQQDAIETAFRYAVETWMQQNELIRVTRNGEVLPLFYNFQSH
jgi:transposase InsO family protein